MKNTIYRLDFEIIYPDSGECVGFSTWHYSDIDKVLDIVKNGGVFPYEDPEYEYIDYVFTGLTVLS